MIGNSMKKIIIILVLASLVGFAGIVPSALAAPSMTPIPMPAKSAAAPYQPIAEQLGQQLQTLVTPIKPGGDDNDEANQELPPTFGTRALSVVIKITEILQNQSEHFVTDFSALPQLSDWFAQQTADTRLVARWEAIGADLYFSVGLASVVGVLMEFVLYPLRRALRRRFPRSLSSRLAVVLSLFSLRAIPILFFAFISVSLLNAHDVQKLSRFLIMNVVYALVLARATVSFLRGVLSPTSENLRFFPATTSQATYGNRWLRAFSLLIIFGYFLIGVARAVHVPEVAVVSFINLLGLVLMLMGIVVIVQKRAFVAHLLRGNLSAVQHDLSWFEALRLWFARYWHKMAIGYLISGYVIAATGVQDGLTLMLRGTLLTLLALVATRLLFRQIGIWEAGSKRGSTTLYTLVKGGSLRILVLAVALAGILAAWGADLSALATSPIGHRLLGSSFSIGTTLFVLGLIYELFSSSVDRHLKPRERDDQVIEASARSRTLLPMVRNILLVIFMVAIGIVVLSEAGINIAPLLAGAGVLGVAVGFGSQTLVKDFLTGLFIVLENAVAVGDRIKIGDYSGYVEAISMRTLRLRDWDGNLHILPFSEVTKITNQTKGFSHALIKVNIGTNSDLDQAIASIRRVDDDMRCDPAFKHLMLESVEIMGVDTINDTSVTLMARIKTQPGGQWDVQRMFLLKLKQRFDKDGVDLPSWTTIKIDKSS